MKSQWEFGELFQPAQLRHVFTVSELTQKVRRLLEQQVGQVWVTGEVSNLRVQTSGHIYFTLKDNDAQLSCVLFKGEIVPNKQYLQDGHKLNVSGDLTVYEARGQYQLLVRAVELQGTGALQIAFERLKQKLQAAGLFAPERKRPLPRYAQRIGLVTSPSGAAIRDVLHVIQRRHPGLEIILSACRVQGDGAADEVAYAIRLLNEWNRKSDHKVDLILLTRGGGSLEDLWAFNEEVVARAIYESAIPIISGVGHEIDFTISDFVADVRAATPSAAAEIITEGMFASRRHVVESAAYMKQLVGERLEYHCEQLEGLTDRLHKLHPRRLLNEKLQYLDDLQSSLLRCLKHDHRHWKAAWRGLAQRLLRERPSQLVKERRRLVKDLGRRLEESRRNRFKHWRDGLKNLSARLRLLGPENVLSRGYSITTDATSGKIIRKSREVKPGQKVRTRLAEGQFQSEVD
jgi:exodeoxyribonuclease VII large subunit